MLVELLLKHADDPMRPEAVSTVMGFAGVATFGLWQLVYTVPRAQALVFDQITKLHPSPNPYPNTLHLHPTP